MSIRIAIIAGEASGDILGSRLIIALKKYYPNASFEGIAGPEMQQAGCLSLYPMERLSVMGFSEVISRLPELLKMRKRLLQRWQESPPDLFVGIDAPDFNLKLERQLYKAGIPTVHYVSPSVWAWREGRVKKMIGSMDLMLCLFPFEVEFYQKYHIPATFTGHPLADEIPLEVDKKAAREELNLANEPFVLAVLPGSRMGEIKRLAPDFLRAVASLHKQHPDWIFVTPLVSQSLKKAFEEICQEVAPGLPITTIDGQSRTVMAAADQILMASGTAVLEGMLVGRPMVAAYRVAPFTARIIRLFKMIKSDYFTLPNNLAKEALVPELIQEDVTPDKIVKAVEKQFSQSPEQKQYILQRFAEIHQQLSQNASQQAAKILHELLGSSEPH